MRAADRSQDVVKIQHWGKVVMHNLLAGKQGNADPEKLVAFLRRSVEERKKGGETGTGGDARRASGGRIASLFRTSSSFSDGDTEQQRKQMELAVERRKKIAKSVAKSFFQSAVAMNRESAHRDEELFSAVVDEVKCVVHKGGAGTVAVHRGRLCGDIIIRICRTCVHRGRLCGEDIMITTWSYVCPQREAMWGGHHDHPVVDVHPFVFATRTYIHVSCAVEVPPCNVVRGGRVPPCM